MTPEQELAALGLHPAAWINWAECGGCRRVLPPGFEHHVLAPEGLDGGSGMPVCPACLPAVADAQRRLLKMSRSRPPPGGAP